MKEKRRNRSIVATLALTTLSLGILLAITLISVTTIVAQNYYQILRQESSSFIQDILVKGGIYESVEDRIDNVSTPLKEQNLPGILEYQLLRTIKASSLKSLEEYSRPRDSMSLTNPDDVEFNTVAIFYDTDGKILMKSGSYVFYPYVTGEKWSKQEENTDGYGYINLNELPKEIKDWFQMSEFLNREYETLDGITWYQKYGSVYKTTMPEEVNVRKMKITGIMTENRIKPVKIEIITLEDLENKGIAYGNINMLDLQGKVEWQTLYDNNSVSPSNEFVTIYASDPEITILSDGEELLSKLEEKKLVVHNGDENPNAEQFTYYDSKKIKIDDKDYLLTTAFSARPTDIAKNELRYVYTWASILFALVWVILNLTIYHKLILPIKIVNKGFSNQYEYIWKQKATKGSWKEPYELVTHYLSARTSNLKQKTELDRLRTALDYSTNAEESRRQMVSNIAHELKTPLAIIQSYSEGLKENIAEEKKDEYYDIILSEIHRMDEMVTDMLDLSRLEAGKTKLSVDEFSLKQMTEVILEKFSKMIAAKHLNVSFHAEQDYNVCADETRLYQVMVNFISNAVIYTPPEGFIRVKINKIFDQVTFTIENTCQPFTKEELEKVWETFYRIDKSRNSKGTGLGLAIAKNIIELHGGTCFVQNTKEGVEFRFTLVGRSL